MRRPGVNEGSGEPLRAVASKILAEAGAALTEPRPEPVAVHDFRKAMKRWRALLRLLEPFLGDPGRELRLQARDLARELSRPRDAQAALDGLADILKRDGALSNRSAASMRRRLNALRKSAENAILTDPMRERIAAMLRDAADAVDRWPIGEIGFAELSAQLTNSYRRVRRRLPDDWQEADAEDLHELRRRVIEHRYQMELVEPLWPRLGKVWVEEAQRLRDRLGRYQDLIVLTQLTAPCQLLAPWRSKLIPAIAERQSTQLSAASRIAGRLFAEKPKAFQRRLEAMWNAREAKRKRPRAKEKRP